MKRFLVLLLCLILAASVMPSCKTKKKPLEITEEEALNVLSDLVPKSHKVNVIFFGEGLPYVAEEGKENYYAEIDESKSEFLNITSIKLLAEKVYSAKYLDSVYVPMFLGSEKTSDDGMLDNDLSPRYKEIAGMLHIYTGYNKVNILGRLDVISVKILKKTPEYVEVEGVCTDDDNKEITKKFYLTKQSGEWLLDSPTY